MSRIAVVGSGAWGTANALSLSRRGGHQISLWSHNVAEAKQRLLESGCEIVKDEPDFPRCYVRDPFGLIYNLTS